MRLATRVEAIEPFQVMALLARAKALEAQGRDIIHMEIGEPDFPTPPVIVEAARRALDRGDTYYTPALGLPALREAISAYYRHQFGIDVPMQRIVITPGASGALLLLLGAVVGPGQGVLMADPGYPCNRHFARFVEGRAQSVAVGPASGYQLTAAHIDEHWREDTVAALLASPANPTGTLVSDGELRAIAQAVSAHDGLLMVDEIYQGLVYDAPASTALAISDQIAVVNSFSKYFHMTGWRLGWLVVPEPLVDVIERLAQNLFLAAPTIAQHAALAAFTPDTLALLEQRRQAFQQRRDFLLPALRELGFEIPVTPGGAFYIYADASCFTNDAQQLCSDLLERAGVAITPGHDFGHNHSSSHVRFAYANSIERLAEGVERIGAFLRVGA